MNARRAPLALVVACALCITPHRATSQDVGASYHIIHSRHELLATLHGAAIELTSERAGIAALRMSYRRSTGSHLRSGSTCPGFVFPWDWCGDEVIYSSASLSEGGLAADLQAIHRRQVDASVTLGIHLSHAVSRSRGLATGRASDVGDRTIWSPSVGAHVSWYPRPQLPLGVRGMVEAARYVGEEQRIVIDALPVPLTQGFGIVRFGAGVVWAFGGRR